MDGLIGSTRICGSRGLCQDIEHSQPITFLSQNFINTAKESVSICVMIKIDYYVALFLKTV